MITRTYEKIAKFLMISPSTLKYANNGMVKMK